MKVLHSICQQIWKTQQWPHDWKRSVFIPIPKKGNAKECSNYHTIALISHASKVMLKILQARLQQYVNLELPDVQAGFRKGRGTRDQITNICWIIKKAREFQKNTSIPPVKKPNGSYHLVQDLRLVNAAVISIHPVVPNPYTLLSLISPFTTYFIILDLKDAFFTIPLHPHSQDLFAFI